MGYVGLSEISDKFAVPQQKATCRGYQKNGTYAFRGNNMLMLIGSFAYSAQDFDESAALYLFLD